MRIAFIFTVRQKIFEGVNLCAVFLLLVGPGFAQTLTLTADLSSKLPSGSPFTATQKGGAVYTGHILTHPARHFLRRGSMQLIFDQPVTVAAIISKKVDAEGVVHARRTRQIVGVGLATVVAQSLDDYVIDPIIVGEGNHKSAYWFAADAAAFTLVLWAQKGGDVKLKAGTQINVEPLRLKSPATVKAPNAGDQAIQGVVTSPPH